MILKRLIILGFLLLLIIIGSGCTTGDQGSAFLVEPSPPAQEEEIPITMPEEDEAPLPATEDEASLYIESEQEEEQLPQEDTDLNLEEPPARELIGTMYADPELGIIVFLNNPEWTFYKDRSLGQVYFFNDVNHNGNNLISMSAQEFTGDATETAKQLWEMMMVNHEPHDVEYQEMIEILVGGEYEGFLFPFTIRADEMTFTFYALFWSAENTMFILTTSAELSYESEVRDVLDGIIESFISM